jgi:hypothetical protein
MALAGRRAGPRETAMFVMPPKLPPPPRAFTPFSNHVCYVIKLIDDLGTEDHSERALTLRAISEAMEKLTSDELKELAEGLWVTAAHAHLRARIAAF